MIPILAAALKVARGRRDHRDRPQTSLVRLLLGELGWAVRKSADPVRFAVAGAASVGAGVLLGPRTPGPVLGGGWRLGVAVLLGFVGLNVVSALLSRNRDESEDDLVYVLRMAVAAVGLVLVAAVVTGLLLAVVTGAAAGPDATAQVLDASLSVDGAVLLGAVLLVAATLASGIGDRLPLPASLVFLGTGMLLGDDGLDVVSLDDPALVQQLAVVALVVILFDGGLGTSAREARLGLGPGLALATLGVGLTAGVVAVGAMVLLDVPARAAWLLGAVVGSTDAAAVIGLLRRAPIPTRLAAVLRVESGMNDPVAVLLTVGLLAAWDVPPSAPAWVVFGAVQLIGGTVVGVATGWAGARLLERVRLGSLELYPVLAVGLAGMAYGAATAVGASGLLAVYLTGLVLGNDVPRRRSAIRGFTQSLAGGAELGLLLMLGLLVFPSRLPAVAAVGFGIALLLTLVARPLATLVALAWFDIPWREQVALAWLGLRGGVPIVLATFAHSAGIEVADTILDIVLFVVGVSLLLQGATAGTVVRRLGLEQRVAVRDVLRQVTPLDEAGMDVVEVEVAAPSLLVGARLASTRPPADVLVVAVRRGDEVVLPRGETQLLAGDLLVCVTADTAGGARRIEDWVRADGRHDPDEDTSG